MTAPLAMSLRRWRAFRRHRADSPGYLLYLAALIGVAVVAPIIRIGWILAADAAVIAAVDSAETALRMALTYAVTLLLALAVGRTHGPIAFPPLLAHLLTRSDIPRHRVFHVPLVRALVGGALGGLLAMTIPVTAGLIGGSGLGLALGRGALGAVLGITIACAWVLGQTVSVRTAVGIAVGVVALTIVTFVAPGTAPLTPLGWVVFAATGDGFALAALTAVTVIVVLSTRRQLSALEATDVMTHSRRWQRTRDRVSALELIHVADDARAAPYRASRAAVHGGLPAHSRFFVRDAIGAARTPGRMMAGILALGLAGAGLGLAFTHALPWLAVFAAVLAYAGLGPLADGLWHVAEATATVAIYGIADGTLLALHSAFPAVAALGILLLIAVAVGLSAGVSWTVIPGAVALALGALIARIADAFSPPMPLYLLFPMPTPMGDLSAAARLLWALDSILLLGGIGLCVASTVPALALVPGAVLTALAVRRWRMR